MASERYIVIRIANRVDQPGEQEILDNQIEDLSEHIDARLEAVLDKLGYIPLGNQYDDQPDEFPAKVEEEPNAKLRGNIDQRLYDQQSKPPPELKKQANETPAEAAKKSLREQAGDLAEKFWTKFFETSGEEGAKFVFEALKWVVKGSILVEVIRRILG
ncbi:hypothetical protein [Cerasicoccus frondis]|uniref:hypothetical protein n=1 Tax=Cerasicoccus frondis TaxID=490090 RepID=UPI00285259C0|nr:hypothetical protein [Cerasicoccus frondis]